MQRLYAERLVLLTMEIGHVQTMAAQTHIAFAAQKKRSCQGVVAAVAASGGGAKRLQLLTSSHCDPQAMRAGFRRFGGRTGSTAAACQDEGVLQNRLTVHFGANFQAEPWALYERELEPPPQASAPGPTRPRVERFVVVRPGNRPFVAHEIMVLELPVASGAGAGSGSDGRPGPPDGLVESVRAQPWPLLARGIDMDHLKRPVLVPALALGPRGQMEMRVWRKEAVAETGEFGGGPLRAGGEPGRGGALLEAPTPLLEVGHNRFGRQALLEADGPAIGPGAPCLGWFIEPGEVDHRLGRNERMRRVLPLIEPPDASGAFAPGADGGMDARPVLLGVAVRKSRGASLCQEALWMCSGLYPRPYFRDPVSWLAERNVVLPRVPGSPADAR